MSARAPFTGPIRARADVRASRDAASSRAALLYVLFAAVALGAAWSAAGAEGGRARKKVKVVSSTTSAAARTKPDEPPASIAVDHPGGVRRLTATVQGRILDEAYPKLADGRRRIVLLVDPPGSQPGFIPPKRSEGGTQVSLSVGGGGSNLDISDAASAGGPVFTDSDAPRWLTWIDPAGDGRIEIVRRDVPGDVRAIDAIDRDGDGNEQIVLWRPGGVWIARPGEGGLPSGPIEALVSDPELDPIPLAARALCDPDCADDRRLWTGLVGALRAYGPSASAIGAHGARAGNASGDGDVPGQARADSRPSDGEASDRARADFRPSEGAASDRARADSQWTRLLDIPLPVNPHRGGRGGFFLTSPAARVVPAAPGTPRLFALGPEVFGRDRLRTLLVDPQQPDAPPKECWSRLPGPESVIESAYLRLDGRPALAVTTRSSVKLGIFAEKWLRIFFLEEDRTRRGAPPALAIETKINLWQRTVPQVRDVDGDGREDLVLPYWKGLKNGHVEIDAYLRGEDGAFARSARTTAFGVDGADRSFLDYGRDLDGDGRADLVIFAGGKLAIHAGSPRSKKGNDLVESAARYTLPLESEGASRVNMPHEDDVDPGEEDASPTPPPAARKRAGAARFIDLDGDGRDEILVVGGGMGDGHLVVFSLPKAASPALSAPNTQ